VTVTDPFSDPAPIASTFASADSFRGRLILIEPAKLELDIPNQLTPGTTQDRMTATVTTVDGQGPVQVYAHKVATGTWLDGPRHEGVWFSQDRIVRGVLPRRILTPGVRVLGRLETYKPGRPAGPGNPWGIVAATAAEKEQAVKFLNELAIHGAQAPAKDENPFASNDKVPF
jgi:hypothetical protein